MEYIITYILLTFTPTFCPDNKEGCLVTHSKITKSYNKIIAKNIVDAEKIRDSLILKKDSIENSWGIMKNKIDSIAIVKTKL